MRTRIRRIALAVTAAFGATAIALSGGMFADTIADIGMVGSAYAKDEGGSSGGHTSGSSGHTSGGATSGGHTSGGGSTSGGHTSGGSTSGGHTSGGATSGGHTSGGAASGGHTSGGATSGGHTSGAKGGGHTTGGEASGGHSSGGKGAPHTTSARKGMEQAGHGTKPGHEGHASGVHGANAKRGGHESTYYTNYASGSVRGFGGGSGIASLEGVLEGPARFAPSSTLSLTEARLPGPKFTFRYWGGWAIPDDGGDAGDGGTPTTYAVEPDSVPIGGGGGPLAGLSLPSPARCDGVGTNMPTKSFYTNSNLVRLDAARMELDPEAIGNKRGLDPTLMVAVQEALVDGKPDAVAIGAYLGMMSRSAVTPESVKRVAYRLCAPMSDELAKNVAQAAEEVRVTAKAD
jgi:hypothetical protein